MDSMWLIYLVLFIAIALQIRSNNLNVVRKHLHSKKGKVNMTEMIKNYIGKECLIYTCTSSSQITGIIKSCNDGWIEVENSNGQCDIINGEYITRIREYPLNKNGKKKSIITD